MLLKLLKPRLSLRHLLPRVRRLLIPRRLKTRRFRVDPASKGIKLKRLFLLPIPKKRRRRNPENEVLKRMIRNPGRQVRRQVEKTNRISCNDVRSSVRRKYGNEKYSYESTVRTIIASYFPPRHGDCRF